MSFCKCLSPVRTALTQHEQEQSFTVSYLSQQYLSSLWNNAFQHSFPVTYLKMQLSTCCLSLLRREEVHAERFYWVILDSPTSSGICFQIMLIVSFLTNEINILLFPTFFIVDPIHQVMRPKLAITFRRSCCSFGLLKLTLCLLMDWDTQIIS